MLVTLSTYVLGMYDTGMVNNHPFEHTSTGNQGHAGWTSLVPRLLPSHMRPKSWERARQQGKDRQPELFTYPL